MQSRFTFNSREGWKDEILVRLRWSRWGSLAGLSVLAFQLDVEKDIYEKERFWRKLNSIKSRKSFSLMFASLRSCCSLLYYSGNFTEKYDFYDFPKTLCGQLGTPQPLLYPTFSLPQSYKSFRHFSQSNLRDLQLETRSHFDPPTQRVLPGSSTIPLLLLRLVTSILTRVGGVVLFRIFLSRALLRTPRTPQRKSWFCVGPIIEKTPATCSPTQ